MGKVNSENFMATALMVQDLLYLEILPNYDCQTQNLPFWIYVLFNTSWINAHIIMKIGAYRFIGVRNPKITSEITLV